MAPRAIQGRPAAPVAVVAAAVAAAVEVADAVAVAVVANSGKPNSVSTSLSSAKQNRSADPYGNLPSYGVGLGFRPVHREELFSHRKSVDFLEIIADHYFDPSPPKQAELELLQANFPLIPHGLALSIGSAEGIDDAYLDKFRSIVEQTQPAWCSDHIAFTRAGGIDIGHLTPVPKSRASLGVIRENLKRVQESIQVPIILENITESIRYPDDEFSDAEFLGQICDENQVGLLLDVTNLYINSVNHRFDPLEVVRRLPQDRIIQLHFVGGRFEDGLWVDSHDCATQDEIWQLLEAVLSMISVKGIILERDERIPPLAELIPELNRARSILRDCQS